MILLPNAGEVIDGLDQAVMKMKQGEKALVTIAPQYAFGDQVRIYQLFELDHNEKVAEVESCSLKFGCVECRNARNIKLPYQQTQQ